MKKKLLLIDTFNFLHRAYHAIPKTIRDQEGNPTNAVYGITSMLINILNVVKPDYVITALDDITPTFRVDKFTGYKAHRKPMENDLSSQIPKVFEVIDAFGVKKIVLPGYEADDVIGTAVHRFKDSDLDIIIVSNDRDLWQLLDVNVAIMISLKGGKIERVGFEEAKKKLGFDPKDIVDYKGLRGDPSDNIPGVYGVGDKTAKKLLYRFNSIDGVYKNIDKVEPESLRKKLSEGYEQAIMSRQLAEIIVDAPMSVELDECKYTAFNKALVKKVLERYNFKSLIKRLGLEVRNEPAKFKQKVHENQLKLF